ncbi:MAG TPA: hydrogenase maturation nickel metallochaperone HypA [Chloroflexota bacterium]|nr:hydrogenase maturation nickel metallochaperone HypA [Chloroflexota bacterium]
MHEAGLMADAVRQAVAAAERAGAPRIERVTFAIAVGGHVTPEAVETLFLAFSRGTIAEGAALAIERRPARACCLDCGRPYLADGALAPDELPPCPACGGLGLRATDAADLALVSIDVPA